jgi:tetratricopeptide (TPR) repeat protein
MVGFEIKRRLLPLPLLAVCFGFPRLSPAQATDAVQPPPAAQVAPNPATPQPTPEEVGDSLSARQRYQAAIAAYEKAPEMTAAIWNKMGIAYQMMFNSKDAVRCYKESLKLDPRNSQVINNLGTVYASDKDYGLADKTYKKAIKVDPKSAVAYKNLGTNLMAEHRYEKGWDAYKRAIALDPQIFEDHGSPTVQGPGSVEQRGAMNYYMALGCARAGYTDCALQYLRMALDEGFITRKKVAEDAEFASLRDNPAFKQLISEQKRNP